MMKPQPISSSERPVLASRVRIGDIITLNYDAELTSLVDKMPILKRTAISDLEQPHSDPKFAFVTTSSHTIPPVEGYLLPIYPFHPCCGVNEYLAAFLVELEKDTYIPAIKITIKGKYLAVFSNDTEVTFRVELVPEQRIQQYDVAIGSEMAWVEKLWKQNCPEFKLEEIPPPRGEYSLRPVDCRTSSKISERPLKANKAQKTYLGMMLMWEFWNKDDYTDENRNDDLKSLDLVSEISDRRSFANLRKRAGCFLFSSAGITLLPFERRQSK